MCKFVWMSVGNLLLVAVFPFFRQIRLFLLIPSVRWTSRPLNHGLGAKDRDGGRPSGSAAGSTGHR
jgi:hypothetical protein